MYSIRDHEIKKNISVRNSTLFHNIYKSFSHENLEQMANFNLSLVWLMKPI